jgi:hypothetical protein
MKNLIKENLLIVIREILEKDFKGIEKIEYFDVDGVSDSLLFYFDEINKEINLKKLFEEEIFNKK